MIEIRNLLIISVFLTSFAIFVNSVMTISSTRSSSAENNFKFHLDFYGFMVLGLVNLYFEMNQL